MTYQYKWLWTATQQYDIRCISNWCNIRLAPAACTWLCSLLQLRYSPWKPYLVRQWLQPMYRHPRCKCPQWNPSCVLKYLPVMNFKQPLIDSKIQNNLLYLFYLRIEIIILFCEKPGNGNAKHCSQKMILCKN